MSSTKNKHVPDIIAPNLDVLFCGINPGLLSAATGYHFARPGNRFWKALHLSGLTPQLLQPSEQNNLLQFGLGITNFVTGPSASAQVLTVEEFRSGAQLLQKKVLKFSPLFLAVLGIEAYRKGFSDKHAQLGRQSQMIGSTSVWLLPNPSGLNAHYSLQQFGELFAQLKAAVTESQLAAK